MFPRLLRLLFAPALAVALLAACAKGGAAAAPAATINGVDITESTVAVNNRLFTFLGALNGGACGTPIDETETQAQACSRFSLSSLIQEQIIAAYAKANDITIDNEAIDETIKGLETSLGDAAALDAKLKTAKVTRTELHDLVRRILLFQEVQKAIGSAELTDAALQKAYEDNIAAYTNVHVQHILVKTEEEANKIYDQVTAPGFTEEDFLALAKDVSIDPGAAENSGDYPDAPASQYVPEFGAAAVALKPGEISEPVQTEYGWHVIRLVSKTVQPFADVKDQVIQSQSGTLFQDWLNAQVEAAKIEVNPKWGVFDATRQEVVPVRSTATGSASASAGASPTP